MIPLLTAASPDPSAATDSTASGMGGGASLVISLLALVVSAIALSFTFRRDRTSLSVNLGVVVRWTGLTPGAPGVHYPPTELAAVTTSIAAWDPASTPPEFPGGHVVSTVLFQVEVTNRGHRPATVDGWHIEFGDGTTRGVKMKRSPFEAKVRLEDGDNVKDESPASEILRGHAGQRKVRAVATLGGGKACRSKWHTLPPAFQTLVGNT